MHGDLLGPLGPTVTAIDAVRVERGTPMAELHEYTQFQCDGCGFRTRSPDEEEVVKIAMDHAEGKHDMDLSREGMEGQLRMLELKGFPESQ